MDDKGSCSFRHLWSPSCVLLSVVPVVHVGGHVCMCSQRVMGSVCIHVYTYRCMHE